MQPLGAGRTDSEGRIDLVGAGGSDLLLHVHGRAHLPEILEGIRAEKGMQRLVVSVEKGAVLRGTITPAAGLARFGTTEAMDRIRDFAEEADLAVIKSFPTRVVVRRELSEQDAQNWKPDLEIPVAADGTFAHAGIPPGTYGVHLHARLPSGRTDGLRVDLPLGRFALRKGEERVIEHDIGAYVPGLLRGRVFVNQTALPFHELVIDEYREGVRGSGYSIHLSTDGEGWFETWLLPGGYGLQLEDRTLHEPTGWFNFGYWVVARDIVIEPGKEHVRTFDVRRVRARVRILDAEGSPVSGLELTVEAEGWPRFLTRTTDFEGWIALEPAPLGPFSLSTGPAGDSERPGTR